LEDGNLYLRLRTMSHTIYPAKFEQMIIHQHVHLRQESQSHALAHVLMRLYPIDKSKSFLYFLKKSYMPLYTVTGNYANLFMPWNTVQVGVKNNHSLAYYRGTYKVRNETKQNEMKSTKTKRNETKSTKMKRNEKMVGGSGACSPVIFLKKIWALETHFPEFKWIIYDISRILSTFIILISLIFFLKKNLVRQLS
jgi:cation transport ATPase